MIQTCKKCKIVYNDVMCLVICPHIVFACRHGKKTLHCAECNLDVKDAMTELANEESIEANTQQIRDPETGVIHAPGLTVDLDGKVTIYRASL